MCLSVLPRLDKLKQHGLARPAVLQAIFAAAQRAQEDAAGSSALACLDYIVACTEYEAFMELAYDHKCVQDAEHNGGDWLPIGESLGELEAF
eukprot:353939-Chlamydomonas_euryale.AAC.10